MFVSICVFSLGMSVSLSLCLSVCVCLLLKSQDDETASNCSSRSRHSEQQSTKCRGGGASSSSQQSASGTASTQSANRPSSSTPTPRPLHAEHDDNLMDLEFTPDEIAAGSRNPLLLLSAAARQLNPRQFDLPKDVTCPVNFPGEGSLVCIDIIIVIIII